MSTAELEQQMDKLFADLQRDLGDSFPADRITAVGHAEYKSIRQRAPINDFIPLLVYRFTKEELVQSRRDELHQAA